MRALVTGAAGFIGSHLCDRLLADGHEVVGVDCFRDRYRRPIKEHNIALAREAKHFAFRRVDLVTDDLSDIVDGAELIYHLAGRPGLDLPTGGEFEHFNADNVIATQRLLEAVVGARVHRFVYASSSSVYGEAERLPTKESALPLPVSAYGVTKLAGEHLARVFGTNLGVPVTVLRYFTVYGPRQRPDMAIARFIEAIVRGDQVEVAGDGQQTRDFTFIADAIEATVRAATAKVAGEVLNIGGGSRSSINAVLGALEDVSGRTVRRRHVPGPTTDPRHSGASINLARQRLAWEPRVSLHAGLKAQWDWFERQSDRERSGSRRAIAV